VNNPSVLNTGHLRLVEQFIFHWGNIQEIISPSMPLERGKGLSESQDQA
jgi:hypothetical protein